MNQKRHQAVVVDHMIHLIHLDLIMNNILMKHLLQGLDLDLARLHQGLVQEDQDLVLVDHLLNGVHLDTMDQEEVPLRQNLEDQEAQDVHRD
jgi:hypothetical protein